MRFFAFALIALSTASLALSSPPIPPDPASDPTIRLTALRAQLQRYETPLIQAWLSRAALGGSVSLEWESTLYLFSQIANADHKFKQPDSEVAHFLSSKVGKEDFDSASPFPPATGYAEKPVLAKDVVLNQADFPVGLRPQDYRTILNFTRAKLDLPLNKNLDSTSTVLLDASILQLASARMLLGYQVGLAKFEQDEDKFCRILAEHPEPKAKILRELVVVKQQNIVLERVEKKAKALIEAGKDDDDEEQTYPKGAADDVVRLFQGYLIPITTRLRLKLLWIRFTGARIFSEGMRPRWLVRISLRAQGPRSASSMPRRVYACSH